QNWFHNQTCNSRCMRNENLLKRARIIEGNNINFTNICTLWDYGCWRISRSGQCEIWFRRNGKRIVTTVITTLDLDQPIFARVCLSKADGVHRRLCSGVGKANLIYIKALTNSLGSIARDWRWSNKKGPSF